MTTESNYIMGSASMVTLMLPDSIPAQPLSLSVNVCVIVCVCHCVTYTDVRCHTPKLRYDVTGGHSSRTDREL